LVTESLGYQPVDANTVTQLNTTTGNYANAAYAAANTADQKAVSSGVYANSAYLQSNTATTNAATADQRAVTSGVYANSAFGVANTASVNATSAYLQSNTATINAATADQRAVTSGVYANSAFATANTKYNSSGGTISGDVNITGNLNVTGSTVTHASDSLVINDPLILLANNNPGNLLDTGFIAHYIEGGVTKHTGLVRDSSANTFYLFDSYVPHIQETNILDPNDATLRITTLRSNLVSDLVVVRGYDVVDHANSAFATANSKGTVTSVGGTGTVNGLTLTGTVTSNGNLTLGGTLNLSSPPAIGGVTANTGSFTNLAYTGTLTGGTGVVNIGSGQVYKDASGNVGIGTTLSITPARLEINGLGSAGRILLNGADLPMITNGFNKFSSGAYSGAGRWGLFMQASALTMGKVSTGAFKWVNFNEDSTETELLRIDSAGNVGIGNNNPTKKLVISDGTAIGMFHPVAANGLVYVGSQNNYGVAFNVNDSERMRLDTSGNLSIGSGGVTNGNKLTVRNSGGFSTALFQHDGGSSFGTILTLETISGSDDPVLGFKNHNGGSPRYYGIGCRDNGSLAFISNASTGSFGDERMRLTETGQLRIGTTAYTGTNEATVAIVSSAISALTWSTRNILLEHGTQPGIGFHAPTYSSAGVFKWWGGGSIFECRNADDNGFVSIAASGFPVSSDYRIKTDVEEFDSVLPNILALRPVNYLKDGSVDREFGFIAHEAAEQFPDLVHGEKDGMRDSNSMELQTFNYMGLTAVLTKAIQEQQAIINELIARIEQLEGA
jgi:hypothetical protein